MPGAREFRTEPLLDVIAHLEAHRGDGPVAIAVPDPDLGAGLFAGERTAHGIHRPFRTWVDLAERLGFRLRTPRALAPPLVELVFEALSEPLHLPADPTARYAPDSPFARIAKTEDPSFVLDLRDALARVSTARGDAPWRDARVLDLGVNRGDEIALLRALGVTAHVTGVDRNAAALAVARARFPADAFVEADLNQPLELGAFDLVVSFGTLHSPGIDDRELLRRIVQRHLAPAGAVILGFQNARYAGGEIEHGTRVVNLREPELGVLVKDVAFYRKYLAQHGKRVFVTGKYEVLVTAT